MNEYVIRDLPGSVLYDHAVLNPTNLDKLSRKLFLILGPACSGKTTFGKILEHRDHHIKVLAKYTTRQLRKDESEQDVKVLTPNQFTDMLNQSHFFYARTNAPYSTGYSTFDLLNGLDAGFHVALIFRVAGAHLIAHICPKIPMLLIAIEERGIAELKKLRGEDEMLGRQNNPPHSHSILETLSAKFHDLNVHLVRNTSLTGFSERTIEDALTYLKQHRSSMEGSGVSL